MSEMTSGLEGFQARLPFEGDPRPVLQDIMSNHGLVVRDFQPVGAGFEDCNFIVETDQGKVFTKVYSKNRSVEEIGRNVLILEAIAKTDLHHPRLHFMESGELAYQKSGVHAVVMDHVPGNSFHDLGRAPNDEELALVVREAVKINKLDIRPPFLYDSWALIYLPEMFARVEQYLTPKDIDLARPVLEMFTDIDVTKLPKAFVHGDLISTNVLLGDDGKIWVVDFSVANTYSRIQELAVMASSLLHDKEAPMSLADRINKLNILYEQQGGKPITTDEKAAAYPMTLAAQAMELLGSYQELFITKNNVEEAKHWQVVGRQGLKAELGL